MCCAHIVYVLLIREIEFIIYEYNEVFVKNDYSVREFLTLCYFEHFDNSFTNISRFFQTATNWHK